MKPPREHAAEYAIDRCVNMTVEDHVEGDELIGDKFEEAGAIVRERLRAFADNAKLDIGEGERVRHHSAASASTYSSGSRLDR